MIVFLMIECEQQTKGKSATSGGARRGLSEIGRSTEGIFLVYRVGNRCVGL
ncbi:hypothetical protein BHY_1488 (plasmid) [Borrelia nietonii YOR]|uniref:Uncharacterized protein n=1 Tax=Borrelia nietonii YOR TaxID=1293576 RepID=W5SCQ1_9SPIR|nr:hypothetical protein [Borrelia nietonii]AHH04438.1 hypothetical protein BHY_1488 [Borrelia nietonii YOR]UPA09990.1 hypothetical protein bhYOR_001319 [Borrelia nietonii YOR]